MPLVEYRSHRMDYLLNTDIVANDASALFDASLRANNTNRLGRGTAYLFDYRGVGMVLRHCMRGGFVRHFMNDSYFFWGLKRTRMWREMHLLDLMQTYGLPVPTPIAARCRVIAGVIYKGDLVTQMIPKACTLTEHLLAQSASISLWQALGATIAQFHAKGIYHADLNAHNIMLDAEGRIYLIDFDKALQKSASGNWRQKNLDRLRRSLLKQQRLNNEFHFDTADWAHLLAAYRG